MKLFILSLMALVCLSALAQNNGDMYRAKSEWVTVLNNSIHHKGNLYKFSSKKCIINEAQEVRIIDNNKQHILMKVVGVPSSKGTSCPNFVIFKIPKASIKKYQKIEDPSRSNFCKLPEAEKVYVDNVIDSKIKLGNQNSFSTNKLLAQSQCSNKKISSEHVDDSSRNNSNKTNHNNNKVKAVKSNVTRE